MMEIEFFTNLELLKIIIFLPVSSAVLARDKQYNRCKEKENLQIRY